MFNWIKQIEESKKENSIFNLQKRYMGPMNRDKIIYHIYEPNGDFGFFAMYRNWLEYIYFADVCGYIPVIEAGSDFAYSDGNKDHNAFESYFIQPKINLRDAKRSSNVIISSLDHRKMVELVLTGKTGHYHYNHKYLYLMSKIANKYMQFNETTWQYINEGMKRLDIKDYKVLGIHIRGTDFRSQYDNHPVYVSEEEVFEKIDKIIGSYDKIFLATDDNRILENFKNKYGSELLCYYHDVVRGDRNKSVIFMKNENARENNKYLLGLEVIRDMYTLAMCDGLICGISQVAICSQIYKLSLRNKYDDLIIVDKGIYNNGRRFRR